jgi:hypothetical protein
MELKAGMWIAKGPEINVLLRLCGKSPMLEIKGAIDLNYFFHTGKAKELDVNSTAITDILAYPENYTFDPPSINDVIANIEGMGKCTFESYDATPEETKKCLEYYKSVLPLYGFETAKAKLRVYIMREFSLRLGQAALFANDILKLIR